MDIGALIGQHGYLALVAGSAIEGGTFIVLNLFGAMRWMRRRTSSGSAP